MDRSPSVLIVDDHTIVAGGMAALLDDAGIDVLGTASSKADALAQLTATTPDVVLVDYRLPDGNGIDLVRAAKSQTSAHFVMVTAAADRRVVAKALEVGCIGFLSKNAAPAEIETAVRGAARGESVFTSDVIGHLRHLERFEIFDAEELSDREAEVLELSAQGRSPEEIAAELYLSVHTVRNHIRNAMTKLQAHTKLEAVVKAVRLRLISIDES